ncbi:MAG: DUF2325 domain-containing protein [Caldanaerobacter sp.]
MDVTLKVFTKLEKDLEKRVGKVDGVIIFTNKVSHELKATFKKCIETLQESNGKHA